MFGVLAALWGGVLTLLFGLFLVAYLVGRIGGERPLPIALNLFVVWMVVGGIPLAVGLLILRRRKKSWHAKLTIGVLLLFIAVGADAQFGPRNWQRVFQRERWFRGLADELKGTIVSPCLEAEIPKGTNVLWSGTFQLVWNELCDLTGGEIHFVKDPPEISALNKRAFTTNGIDPGSYVALAGFVRDDIYKRIPTVVEERLGARFSPRLIPQRPANARPQDIAAYACLAKQLNFAIPFEQLDQGLTFKGVAVRSFGVKEFKAECLGMYPQIQILDYRSPDDFIVELKTDSDGDRLMLAKIKREPTLSDTISEVSNRIRNKEGEPASTNDVLNVPRIKFDITREYAEFVGELLTPGQTKTPKDLSVLSAAQNTRFEMNEKGAQLASEAEVSLGCAKKESIVPAHVMIFDKPFLITLSRRDSEVPYFAFWAENAELMIRL
jgi:hypothetical protein